MRRSASILALATLVFGCGGEVATSESTRAPAAKGGQDLYASQGCALCHAADGTGTSFGPTLHGKKGHWTRETLVQYLKNPAETIAKDPRLLEQSKRYSMAMQRFDKLPEAELSALADHVLRMP